ncbi:MAG: hypothetical protein HKN36_02045 [Hellea sp.]|nr:hypothetical protein [Hellea sp.]
MSRDNNVIDFKARKKAAEKQAAAQEKAQRAQRPAQPRSPLALYVIIILIVAGFIGASFK